MQDAKQDDNQDDRGAKNQGEGDYEAARRFNDSERKFVKQHGTPRQPDLEREEAEEVRKAEDRARARGVERRRDAIDAEVLREKVSRRDQHRR